MIGVTGLGTRVDTETPQHCLNVFIVVLDDPDPRALAVYDFRLVIGPSADPGIGDHRLSAGLAAAEDRLLGPVVGNGNVVPADAVALGTIVAGHGVERQEIAQGATLIIINVIVGI
jgi:hypothetical protein